MLLAYVFIFPIPYLLKETEKEKPIMVVFYERKNTIRKQ
jgi:hypothetical protein